MNSLNSCNLNNSNPEIKNMSASNDINTNSVETKTESVFVNTVATSETQQTSKVKKNIFDRLIKNAQDALNQQNSQETFKDDFTVSLAVPDTIEVPVRGVKKEITIDVKTTKVNERDVVDANTIGCRETMEDQSIAHFGFINVNNKEISCELYGIFDGHGGDQVSIHLKKHLPQYLFRALTKSNLNVLTDEVIFHAIKESFISLNNDIYKNETIDIDNGSTATVAIILQNKIWVANTGDSRAILIHNEKTIQLTEDAKPNIERYKRKINQIGGDNCVYGGRILGDLSVARAFGDKEFKSHVNSANLVLPNPKITCYSLEDYKGAYLLISCDGLYEQVSSNQVGNALQVMVRNNEPLDRVSKKLIYNAIMLGSKDNISIVLTKL